MQNKELTVKGKIQLYGTDEEKENALNDIADALKTLLKIQIVKDNGKVSVLYSPFPSVELVDGELTLCISEKTIAD